MFPTAEARAGKTRARRRSGRRLHLGRGRILVLALMTFVLLLTAGIGWTSMRAANATTVDRPGTPLVTASKISLLPMSKGSGPWEWYRSCEFVPSAKIPPTASSGCQTTDPIFGPFLLNGDLWNLGSTANGDETMAVNSSGTLTTTAGFSSVPERSRATWVLGYPNVSYGVEPQAPKDSPPRSPSLPLPMKVSALPTDVLATADYWVIGSPSVRFDFAYDLWLEPQLTVGAPTTGTIELMIWTYDSGSNAVPPGYEGQVSMNYAVNGAGESGKWGLYITNGNKGARTQTTVDLVLTKPVNAASVSVDINGAIQAMETTLKRYDSAHWSSFSGYYLDSIPLGSEFGAVVGKTSASPFLWSMDSYYLSLGAKLP